MKEKENSGRFSLISKSCILSENLHFKWDLVSKLEYKNLINDFASQKQETWILNEYLNALQVCQQKDGVNVRILSFDVIPNFISRFFLPKNIILLFLFHYKKIRHLLIAKNCQESLKLSTMPMPRKVLTVFNFLLIFFDSF